MKNKVIIKLAFSTGVILCLLSGVELQKKHKTPIVPLQNIEALASSEGNGGNTYLKCYQTVSSVGNDIPTHVTYCGECRALKVVGYSNVSTCR